MSSATEANVLLLRAVEKQAPLYDRDDERYRKRLPSENSWDMVASEVGEPVEKCKRRWRQLRNDYTRWCNADANRRRSGQRRVSYPLADELRFLDRHLNLADDERSVSSDKDRDSNRDSESRDQLQQQPQVSLKREAAPAKKPVRQGKPISKLTEEVVTSEINGVKVQTEEGSPKQELDEAEEPEKVPELDSFLQSDNEGDECEDEEHLEQLEGFDFDLEQEQEQESSPDKSLATDNADSPASQSEFFIKQSNDPHLLIIGKKNSTSASVGEPEGEDSNSGDPLEEEDGEAMEDSADESVGAGERGSAASDTAISPSGRLRRLRRAVRSSLSSAGIKDLPIQKPGLGQRLTRLQRRKSMSLAAVHSVRSATSPVKMTPVPRSQPINKPPSGHVQIKKVNPRDDIFPRPSPPAASQNQNQTQNQNQNQTKTPRPSTPAGSQNQNQNQNQTKNQQLIYPKSDAVIAIPQVPAPPPQRRSVGRPPKKIQFIQRMVVPQPRPQSPVPTKVLTISKPSSASVNGGTSGGSNTANKSTSSASTMTKVSNTLKSPDNITVMSYSPSSTSTTSSAKTTSSPSGTVMTAVPTTSTAGSSIAVPPYITLLKRVERSTQTDSPSIFSDDHFLEMIKPQMREMNPRQKMHFKQKVFQALMETFDDATDFPAAGELQHFNINTPSGFEHVSDPELRLVRELVSMVSAAKVTVLKPTGGEAAPARSPVVSDVLRGPRPNVPRHVIQRVYKPGTGLEIAGNSAGGAGQEKKMYRILQMSGKPNGNLSASLENLRKESVDSNHSAVRVAQTHNPVASPKGATIVSAVRPQGLNNLFGQANAVQPAKGGPPVKVRAMSRRYSVCGSGGNPANAPPASAQVPANGSSLNSNLSPMEAAMLKRRLMAPAQGMVPPSQRPRYSAVAAGQMGAVPHGSSLLVRKSVGSIPGNQKLASPTGGVSTPQKTPQIASVQGAAFNDFVHPKAAATSSASTSTSSEGSSPSSALKRSLVVANTKTSFQDLLQQSSQPLQRKKKEFSETAATIAADDFSLASLKREPVDHIDDQDDILGM
ncbi:mucin-5AC [Drosophila elegans]|uniref:mucin-5AC n=1 Tax=Drosophila elegans TaxID=30023 RepID=UPI0007E6C0A3|nr:mucin-5AC [Drosophila elegans]